MLAASTSFTEGELEKLAVSLLQRVSPEHLPVVECIRRLSPKEQAQVRFLSGRLKCRWSHTLMDKLQSYELWIEGSIPSGTTKNGAQLLVRVQVEPKSLASGVRTIVL